MEITIAIAENRKATTLKNVTMELSDFYAKLGKTVYGNETMTEYLALTKDEQGDRKDVGGFVGGAVRDGKRKKGFVENRCLLTLDIDYGIPGLLEEIEYLHGFNCCLYSTRKHTEEHPRLRLVVPLKRPVDAEEYEAVARKIASDVGIDLFDDSTYQAERLMYWPSTCKGAEFVHKVIEGDMVDPDEVLARYSDWHNVSEWPISSRVEELKMHSGNSTMQDPEEKAGLVGAFCRTYDVHTAIAEFLSDVYEPTEADNRYTFVGASTSGGLVVYEDKYAYSHHSTDPVSGRCLNAFDLVRIHLYGTLDEKIDELRVPPTQFPSYRAMQKLFAEDAGFKERVADTVAETNEEANDFEDWKCLLKRDEKTGKILSKLENFVTIMKHDEAIKAIAKDVFCNKLVVTGSLPWKRLHDGWYDSDNSELKGYIDRVYGIYNQQMFRDALAVAANSRAFNPVLDYFNGLPEWDGVPRVETLLIDYLGAADTRYVRAVTRKTLVAVIARAFMPGVKFDTILVLNGPQKIGKSTLIAKLGMSWYSNSLSVKDMDDPKKAAEKIQGILVMELCELAGMRKAEVEQMKSFITTQKDDYRPSYGTVVESHPRQGIIIGTTNAQNMGYLTDPTGNRRFWPVRLSLKHAKNSWDLTDEDICQIWAEALRLYKGGEPLILDSTDEAAAVDEQRNAMEEDPLEGIIRHYLDTPLKEDWDTLSLIDRRGYINEGNHYNGLQREYVCNAEIWNEALGKDPASITPADSRRIGKIMARIEGWERVESTRNFSGYKVSRYYKRVDVI